MIWLVNAVALYLGWFGKEKRKKVWVLELFDGTVGNYQHNAWNYACKY